MYTTKTDQEYTNNIMLQYYKDLNKNFAWLNQKTEESKGNKGHFTFPTHRVNVTEL